MLEVLGEVAEEIVAEAGNIAEKVSETAVKAVEASHLSDELKVLEHLRPENMLRQTVENIENGTFSFADLREFRPVSDCSSLLSRVQHIRSKSLFSMAAERRKDAMSAKSMTEFVEKHRDAHRLTEKALSARDNEKLLNHVHGLEQALKGQVVRVRKAQYAGHM